MSAGAARDEASARSFAPPARLGFLGVGWIGRHRLEAVARSGAAEIVAVADTSEEAARAAAALAGGCAVAASLEALLALPLDGIVIATPSAQHPAQAIRALEAGRPVFCQKPLGTTAAEVARVVQAARAADRRLGVDLSYREVAGMAQLRALVQGGALGRIHAVNLVFHNAYGPDRAWFYDVRQSGGGCVMDLGIHLVDLALWVLGFPSIREVTSRVTARGAPVAGRETVEDCAHALLLLEGETVVQLACSWRLPAGRDCVIEASFYGTEGGVSLHNVEGSFLDLEVERYRGTRRERLGGPPDAWGGRATVAFADALAAGRTGFDREAEGLVRVSEALEAIYARAR